ncbi:MAG: methionyl-tRNA formyltransferase [Alphaproteobacteria bacterium]|jgi:methionyl-tRNA formyltransferase|nr:methionyl-tRNA formyltransferase [Alphaproteobacteria bacterium]
MKIAYMGTPDFAVPALKKLIEKFGIEVVYCKEPKPVGRGHKIKKTPVHIIAEENNIEVRTPKSLRKNTEEWNYLKSLDLDYIVVCAYGLILPQELLDIPSKGCINIHGSLLPRWRGAAPLQRAILEGDEKTGITIMKMDAGLDTGDMLLKGELSIDKNTTAISLHDDMANLGGELIVEYIANPTKPEKQDDSMANYANKITKDEGLIDWNSSAEKILRQYNALAIWPGVYFELNGQNIKVKSLELVEGSGKAGEILNKDMVIACSEGAIKLNKLQKPGKSAVDGIAFFNGTQELKVGDVI